MYPDKLPTEDGLTGLLQDWGQSYGYISTSGNFEGNYSGGIQRVFGQEYHEGNRWLIWAYNNGEYDWIEGWYEAYFY